jgi:hypothetical protein
MLPLIAGAAAALGGAKGIGTMVGMTVVPMILEHLLAGGPSEEDKAKVKGILDSEAMKRATEKGIALSQAQAEVQAEIGPMLEKAIQSEPSALAGLAGMAVGGVAGHRLGGKFGASKMGRGMFADATRKGAFSKDIQAQARSRVEGRKATAQQRAQETPPGMGQATQLPPDYLKSRRPAQPMAAGEEGAWETGGYGPNFANEDDMLRAMSGGGGRATSPAVAANVDDILAAEAAASAAERGGAMTAAQRLLSRIKG